MIFVDADADECILRRIVRDVKERGRNPVAFELVSARIQQFLQISLT